MRSLRLPPEFLADLKAVAPALREESISAGFLNDLAVIHAAVLETAADEYPSEDELRFVSEQLQELYWRPRETREEPSIEGLKDKDNVLSMIKRVGDAACREAADF